MSTNHCDTEEAVRKEPRPTSRDLWKHYHRQGGSQMENELVERYLPLVRTAVGRLAMTLPDFVDHDDLHSAGLIGLLQALRNFDPNSGTPFESYARQRIRGAMLDELRRMDWVPRAIHEKSRKMQEVMNRLEQELGRVPTEAEMAGAMRISPAEYNALLDEIRPAQFVCLDAANVSDGTDAGSLYEVVAASSQDGPMEEVSRRELKQVILERLKQLPEIQRKVLALYYGEDLRLREIAEVFGLTESRICQIHAQAILSIRSYLQRFESGLAGPGKSLKPS